LRDTVSADVIERLRGVFARRDAAAAEGARKTYANLQRSVAKLSAAGANIILGCDTGLEDHFFGYAEQKELELMVDAGMTRSGASSRPVFSSRVVIGLLSGPSTSISEKSELGKRSSPENS